MFWGENELTKELLKLRKSHAKDIHSLKGKVKKAEDKCSAKQKEWEPQETRLQDKVASLEKKFKENDKLLCH